jgi:histidinol phosphatase-like PHP family hydrolase
MDLGRRCEFHTHTFFSDGVLAPVELVRRAFVLGDRCIALTDHVDFTNVEHVLKSQLKIKGNIDWDIRVLVGVELTHIPVGKIPKMVALARQFGAEIVVGHGESPVEPVEKGTNHAYVKCPDVDILAHPGKLVIEDAQLARENGIFIELTSRKGHDRGNKAVAKSASAAKALMIVDTDAHTPENLITQKQALQVALKAGLPRKDALKVVVENPDILLGRIGRF